mmetsp:Transcript_19550/g.63464  ORF Transcript_19550/g.63464 Transcript_19550/m.63464 type:complete len:222 (+) Transcript_19550:1028-1693(+)
MQPRCSRDGSRDEVEMKSRCRRDRARDRPRRASLLPNLPPGARDRRDARPAHHQPRHAEGLPLRPSLPRRARGCDGRADGAAREPRLRHPAAAQDRELAAGGAVLRPHRLHAPRHRRPRPRNARHEKGPLVARQAGPLPPALLLLLRPARLAQWRERPGPRAPRGYMHIHIHVHLQSGSHADRVVAVARGCSGRCSGARRGETGGGRRPHVRGESRLGRRR